MKKIKKIFALMTLPVCLVLISCESEAVYTKILDNQTGDTVTITYSSVYGFSGTVEILPGQKEVFYNNGKLGAGIDKSYGCLDDLESISLTFSSGRTLKLDPEDVGNWERKSREDRQESEEICTFRVSEADLE